jgi:predicted MPP superfamily phosphohydrolase
LEESRKKRTYRILFIPLTVLLAPLMIYSILVEPNMIFINTVSVSDNKLFDLFKDKTVVHISDLHITSIGLRERKLIKMLNKLSPDILFITGDLLVRGEDYTACIDVLRRIHRPRYGIWVTLGNTDRVEDEERDKEIDQFILELEQLDINVLENARQRMGIKDDGMQAYILGVLGFQLSRSKLEWLLRDIPDSAAVILLSHYPDIFAKHPDALVINLEETEDTGVSGWGWQDNSFTDHDSGIIRFEKDGIHTLRVQRREDGVSIEQICLVAEPRKDDPQLSSKAASPDASGMYKDINPHSADMIVIETKDILQSRMSGAWKKIDDSTSHFTPVITDAPDSKVKHNTPLLEPEDYFEVDFYARGEVNYHIWVRMKAEDNLYSNDSFYIQFNDSVDKQGNPVYRIGGPLSRNKFENVDLILAGHTHGGQIRIPFIGGLDFIPFHTLDYERGLFTGEGTKMYVNRGIGTSIIPMRFLCPPEITVLEFSKENDNYTSERK